ncbi:hypothetical protein P3S67_010035 [Capsicum chacoense]
MNDVFKEVIQSLPYAVPYEFIPFTNGLNLPVYDDVLHGITSLDYDAVVGDVTILARRSKYVDFTLPFTESGISAVVPVRDDKKRNAWIFLKPLKSELWMTTGTFFVFIGFVVWVLERRVNNEFRGPKHKQVGMIFCGKYIMFGPTYKAAGFGFAFPKGSPLVPDVSRAVLEKDAVSIISDSLALNSFKGLFLTAGVSSGSALLIYVFIFIYHNREILATNDSIEQKISAIANAFDEEKDNSNSKSENAEANESQTATLFAASEASSPEILSDLPLQSPEIRISDGLG